MNIQFESECSLAVVGEGEVRGGNFQKRKKKKKHFHIDFSTKVLFGANCRELDDIMAIFMLHNAQCHIVNIQNSL